MPAIAKTASVSLAPGTHTIAVSVDGVTQAALSATIAIPQPAAPTSVPSGVPIFYVDAVKGLDTNDGSIGKPWKTAKAVSNAAVVLTAGQTFGNINFSNLTNAWVGASDPSTRATVSSGYCINYTASSNKCTLANVIVTSPDGKGQASNVHGSNITLLNVDLGNLNEGFDHETVTNLTITGGKQVGAVAGRCHYFIDVTSINWSNAGPYGPASTQSPIRFSYPGVRGGTISNVTGTQVGSTFAIATWAIHDATNVTFNSCTANGGEFSFNSAGAGGTTDKVTGCIINDLVVINSKLTLDANVSFNNTFNRPVCSNPTGECIGLSDTTTNGNNKIIAGKLTSPKHGVHFYGANDTVISGTTLYAPSASVPIIDGSFTKANDGGGNVVVVKA